MPFPASVRIQALQRSGNQCECTRITCSHHTGRCTRTWGLEAHHIVQGGSDTLSNCEILCDQCHKNTRSYGRS